MSRFSSQAGVSLLEIMLVLVIISLLAVIAIPPMEEAALRPKLDSAASSLGTIADAVRMCQADTQEGTRAACLNQPNLNDTITKLESMGYLKKNNLADNFCYSWDSSEVTSETIWIMRMKAELSTRNGEGNLICPPSSPNLKKAVYYRFASDIVSGRGGDQKWVPANATTAKARSSFPDNF